MGWFKEMATKVAVKWLDVQPAIEKQVTIRESLSHSGQTMCNRILYRGDPSELEQFFKGCATNKVTQSRFWASVPSDDLNVRKFHSGLPAIAIDKLTDIVVADLDQIEVDKDLSETWEEISKDNKFIKLIEESIKETLIVGDGAFKITMDTTITPYPIIEFYGGERVDYVIKRGRLFEVLFYTPYTKGNKKYTLVEIFGKGYITNKLYQDGKEVPLQTLEETKDLVDVTYNSQFIMAIPMMFFKSPKFDSRGKGLFDTKIDSSDALDEVISQWIDAIRRGRVKEYFPEEMLPKNPMTGEVMKPNSFDNQFIAYKGGMAEDNKNQIVLQQPDIKHTAYIESYANAVDMLLQGVISPSTLGIDLKKTDNAEAQREKEKTTLYMRGKIIDVLNEIIPHVIDVVLKVYELSQNKIPLEHQVTIGFGEYASPDFDTVVDTVGKARSFGIMSIEKAVAELYGDTMSDEEKIQEIKLIKEQNGMLEAEEPKVHDDPDEYGDDLDVE